MWQTLIGTEFDVECCNGQEVTATVVDWDSALMVYTTPCCGEYEHTMNSGDAAHMLLDS